MSDLSRMWLHWALTIQSAQKIVHTVYTQFVSLLVDVLPVRYMCARTYMLLVCPMLMLRAGSSAFGSAQPRAREVRS